MLKTKPHRLPFAAPAHNPKCTAAELAFTQPQAVEMYLAKLRVKKVVMTSRRLIFSTHNTEFLDVLAFGNRNLDSTQHCCLHGTAGTG
jgi:hypothetical protein